MIRRISYGIAAAAVLAATTSCSGSNNLQVNVLNVTFTLQGIVADAVTGARIGGDLKMYLIQGPEIRGPSRLISGSGDPLLGEYAFVGVPAKITATSNTFKVVAIKTGYQRFESEISFPAELLTAGVNNDLLVDGVYNMIGNIYLFPVGVTAPDYTFMVEYNGKPVPNATVQLDPVTIANQQTFSTSSALPATNGYVASLQATSDANGIAKFAGTNLAVGARYDVTVLPVTFTDSAGTKIPLALYTGFDGGPQPIFVGLDTSTQVLPMSDLNPSSHPLYVTSESNRPAGVLQANGSLALTFNAAVSVGGATTGFAAAVDPGVAAAGGAGAAVLCSAASTAAACAANKNPVIASVSADGLTLTLAPNWETPPAATDKAVSITYGNGGAVIIPKDYPSAGIPLFGGIRFVDGSNIDPTVNITGP